jgi:hypothetical protein
MGTNYYWHENSPCPYCGRNDDPIHIGKSSAGWNFALHVYPDNGINNLGDWKKKFIQKKSNIIDEYGVVVEGNKMIEIITERSWERSSKVNKEWYRENYAHEGKNGLAAHNVDGHHCIGNGEGTWDYLIGDFS